MRFDLKTTCLVAFAGIVTPAMAQQDQLAITLERTICFGSCPAYLLRVDSSGSVSLKMGPPSNRHEEHTSRITTEQFQELLAGFTAIRLFELHDLYQPTHTDGPTTHITVTLNGKTKEITHPEEGLPELRSLERTVERTVNIHRWLHGDPRPFTLQSPVAGLLMGGGEDLKNESFVRQDVYWRIKPGLTPLMQAAGEGNAFEIRRALEHGDGLNTVDETGWTALMIAAVAGQPSSVTTLLDAAARVDQRDAHGDTALIGAAAVRFGSLAVAARIVATLLEHGAPVDGANQLGETPLMWAARAGNPDSIRVLLDAGASPERLDQSGHNALFYLRSARDSLTFDKSLVERYDRAESLLNTRK